MIDKPNELRRVSLYTMEGRQPAVFAAEIRIGSDSLSENHKRDRCAAFERAGGKL
jgi:hypothetical protein